MNERTTIPGAVSIRVYAELNNFLPKRWRHKSFSYPLNGGCSLKHMIESAGIPHTEIELILLNGKSVDFSAEVKAGDRISIYPVFESIDVTPIIALRPEPLRKTRFVLDVHLGKLALILRLLGFDAKFPGNIPDEELAEISSQEHRILLTRDTMLLKRNIVTHGCYLHSQDPEEQATEILNRLDLRDSAKPFSRCTGCGAHLKQVRKERINHRLEPLTRKYYSEFSICIECDKIYWKGSHYQPLTELLKRLNIHVPDREGSDDE